MSRLYVLKHFGLKHLKANRYQQAMLYFRDILLNFNQSLSEIIDDE